MTPAPDTSSSRRCSTCALNFPPELKWNVCAQCGGATDPMGNAKPNLTDAEATVLLRKREFEEYLDKKGIE